MIDQDDYWQCAFVIAKGGFDAIQDAVAPANILAGPLARGAGADRKLPAVQRDGNGPPG